MQDKIGDMIAKEVRKVVREELSKLFSQVGSLPSDDLTPGQKAAETKRRNGTLQAAAKKAAATKSKNGTHAKAAKKAARTRKKNLAAAEASNVR